jgi:hypothetical protein
MKGQHRSERKEPNHSQNPVDEAVPVNTVTVEHAPDFEESCRTAGERTRLCPSFAPTIEHEPQRRATHQAGQIHSTKGVSCLQELQNQVKLVAAQDLLAFLRSMSFVVYRSSRKTVRVETYHPGLLV